MDKPQLSNKIRPEIQDVFDALTERLGPPKNRILEASIEVFAELDKPIQRILKGNDPEDRRLCFDLIRALRLPPPPHERGGKARSGKS